MLNRFVSRHNHSTFSNPNCDKYFDTLFIALISAPYAESLPNSFPPPLAITSTVVFANSSLVIKVTVIYDPILIKYCSLLWFFVVEFFILL